VEVKEGVEKAKGEGRGREYRKERDKKVLCRVGGAWNSSSVEGRAW